MNTLTTSNTALVMGAGDSLGSALARRFAREGMQVCVARRNAEQLEPLVERLRNGVRQARSLIGSESVDNRILLCCRPRHATDLY